MTASEIQTLLDDANCLVCQGMSLQDAIKIVLLNQISGAQPKVYRALLSQDGIPGHVPTLTVLRNDFGTITWAYVGVGLYNASNSGFIFNKTFVSVDTDPNSGPCIGQGAKAGGNLVAFAFFDDAGNPLDGTANNSIEILVYP